MIPPLSQAIFYQIFPPGARHGAGIFFDGMVDLPGIWAAYGRNLLEYASWRVVYAVTLPMSALDGLWPGGGSRTWDGHSAAAGLFRGLDHDRGRVYAVVLHR